MSRFGKIMSADDVNKGREILNTELPVNSQDAVFVFNNYGIIDPYFEGRHACKGGYGDLFNIKYIF